MPTVYYSVLNDWLRTRGIFVGVDQKVGEITLDCIEHYCIDKGIPDLTALVVNKELGHAGPDFFVQNGLTILSPLQQHAKWLVIAERVIQQRTNYSVQSPPDLCKHGNCAEEIED